LYALIVLVLGYALYKVSPQLFQPAGGDPRWVIVPILIVLVTLIMSVTWMESRSSTTTVDSSRAEKEVLIDQNRELVVDADKPPLSRDDLTKQVQQLRPVLNQAARYSTPTYFLDKHLSIIHWNVAFELIFKPILPKIQRRHVNHFIAELANRDQVFDHARAFTQQVMQGELPLADVEPLVYNSENYGIVEFEKVATQLTDSDANLKAWAVALFLKKIDWDMYAPDLWQRIRDDKLWGIYAVSYDAILPEFSKYRQLIDEVMSGIPAGSAHVLELGAGTGNATRALLQRGYRVTAVENNPVMLDKLSAKNLQQTGRLTICIESAEDIELVEERNLDAVVAVNLVYALDDPAGCFRDVARILKRGGVFAFSTTHSGSRLDPLLAEIEADLKARGVFRAKEEHYRRVAKVNKDIECRLARRYSIEQYEAWLEDAGFEIVYNRPSYVGAVVVIHARKV
jgi:SAM-dependent methyltransferase